MQKTIKFIVAVLASLCFFYLIVVVAKAYAWMAIPFITLFIILLWKKDRYVGIGALTAFMMSVIALLIVFYSVPDMKMAF